MGVATRQHVYSSGQSFVKEANGPLVCGNEEGWSVHICPTLLLFCAPLLTTVLAVVDRRGGGESSMVGGDACRNARRLKWAERLVQLVGKSMPLSENV